METGATAPSLFRALSQAQEKFPPVVKNRTATVPTKSGGSFSYTYADLGQVVDAVVPVLRAHDLVVLQPPQLVDGQDTVQTLLVHTVTGEQISSTIRLTDCSTPQAAGSALTYMRRYALCSLLGVVADEDDDGAAATHPQTADRAPTGQNPPQRRTTHDGVRSNPTSGLSAATEKQINFIYRLAEQHEINDEDLSALGGTIVNNADVGSFTKADAKKMIDYLLSLGDMG